VTYEFWVKLENFTNAREKQGACSQAKPKLPTGVEIWSVLPNHPLPIDEYQEKIIPLFWTPVDPHDLLYMG